MKKSHAEQFRMHRQQETTKELILLPLYKYVVYLSQITVHP